MSADKKNKFVHEEDEVYKEAQPPIINIETARPRSPVSLDTVPAAADIEKRGRMAVSTKITSRSASKSPVTRSQIDDTQNEMPVEFQLQITTQHECFKVLEEMMNEIKEIKTLNLIDSLLEQLQATYEEFRDRHNVISTTWPPNCNDRSYFDQEVNLKFNRLYRSVKRAILMAKDNLISHSSKQVCSSGLSRLPSINLPDFTGDYLQWPTFKELFDSVVMQDAGLQPIAKLHYLRGCVKGEPAKLISSLPLVSSSLETALNKLENRYGNPRLLIQSQLDKLDDLKHTQKGFKALDSLLATVEDVRTTLINHQVKDLSDCLLVHLMTRQLEGKVREDWEHSLGDSKEFPKYQDLRQFLTSRARAMERLQKPEPAQQKRSAHTTQINSRTEVFSSSKGAYQCDVCNDNHFIIACPKFLRMDNAERRKLVEHKKLCFNCLGRHIVRACRSNATCKHCKGRHHTMLHEIRRDSAQASSPDNASSQ